MAATGLLERLAGEAHLWLTPLAETGERDRERAWLALLSAAELEANRRFRVEPARRQHLAARALVRTTLSRYVEVEPRRWRFRSGSSGRPEIERPAGLPPLRFNLSHTRGLVACLVTLGLDAGVDVEHPGRAIRDPMALAEHSFAPAEQQALRLVSGGDRRRLFGELWTLKEAYVKARGAGFLSLPASRFAYQISDGGIRLAIGPELEDDPEAWQTLLLASSRHRLAVAIRRRRRPDLELAAWEVEPLIGEPRRVRLEVLARSPAPPPAVGAAAGSRRAGVPPVAEPEGRE